MNTEFLFSPTGHISRKKIYISISIIIFVICLWLGLRAPIAFPLDDAYITLHNASVLISGVDENYPGTSALIGATSAVHLGLVAGLSVLFRGEVAAYIIGTIGIILYALGLVRLAFSFGGSPILALMTLALGLLSGYASYHLLNGLETGLAMSAATWALVFSLSEKPTRFLPILCGTMPFIRPEFVAFSILLMACQCRARLQFPDAISSIIRDFSIFLFAALPWILWIWWDTGQFMPVTVSAKAAFFAEGGYPAIKKIFLILAAINLMTITVFIGFILKPRNLLDIIILCFLVTFMMAYYIKIPGALHHNHFRYLQIIIPFSIYFLLKNARQRPLARYLLIASAAIIIITFPRSLSEFKNGLDRTNKDLANVAKWTELNLPTNARILIHDAGYISYKTKFELIDLVGLKIPASVKFHQQWTAPSNGNERSNAINQIALHFQPTHAVIINDKDKFWSMTADSLRRHGWVLETLRPASINAYAVFKLIPPH